MFRKKIRTGSAHLTGYRTVTDWRAVTWTVVVVIVIVAFIRSQAGG